MDIPFPLSTPFEPSDPQESTWYCETVLTDLRDVDDEMTTGHKVINVKRPSIFWFQSNSGNEDWDQPGFSLSSPTDTWT